MEPSQTPLNAPAANPQAEVNNVPQAAPAGSTQTVAGTQPQTGPVGAEYVFMALTLLVGAVSLAVALLLLINDASAVQQLAFPAAALLVCAPVFTVLFLHLKYLELRRPELRSNQSKRRSGRFLQILAFLSVLGGTIGFVFCLFNKLSGHFGGSLFKAFLDAFVIIVVAGGILAYYWYDEHRPVR